MATYRHPLIAREGWPYLFLSIAAALVAHAASGVILSAPLCVLAGAVAYLFRDPRRKVPPVPLAVVSPADAQVVEVVEATDPWLERASIRITLEMGLASVYSIRSPIEGKVMRHWYPVPGRESYAQWVQSDEGDDVVFSVDAATTKKRGAFCYLGPGERIGQGQRCGYLPFGARLAVWLPKECRPVVKPGERVLSGSDILAKLIH